MASTEVTVRGKRKASQLASQSIKRTRVEVSAYSDYEDDDDAAAYESSNSSHSHHDHSHDSAEDSQDDDDDDHSENLRTGTNTPSTPFSPTARVKRPSEYKTLRCPYEGCDKTFNRPTRLEAHKRSHTNERPFKCEYEGCDKAYMQEKHLKQHIKGSHLHEKTYMCEWEGCGKTFLTGQRLRRHQKVHEGEERFRCTGFPPCNATFRKHQTMQRHIRSAHMQLPQYPCTFVDPDTSVPCNAAFDAAGSLRKHIDRFHNDPRFTCEECVGGLDEDGQPLKVTFPTKSQLTAHVREQHAAQCIFCDLKCSSQQSLRQHIESQHSATTLEDRKKIACTYPGCDKRFVKTSNLNAHVLSVHKGKKFECGKVDLHDTAGAGSWDGQNSCGLPFSTKANLVDHVRTQHMGLPSIINAGRIKGTTKPVKKKATKKTSAIDELTGNVYSAFQGRNISCAFPDCPHKFLREYDHQVHLMSKHAMTDEQAIQLSTGQVVLNPRYVSHNMGVMMGPLPMGTPPMNSFGTQPTHDPHFEPSFEAGSFQVPDFPDFFPSSTDPRVGDSLAASPDRGLQMQGQVMGDRPFWIGAEYNEGAVGDDTWMNDEREMHQLIDRDVSLAEANRFWDSMDSIDPMLREE